MTLNVGILLALLCALTTNLGFLYKHRGAVAAPAVNWRHPLRSGIALFQSKWFAIGMGVSFGAWLLHVGAMALAPLSLVQAVVSGGLVLLAVLAERVFGFKVGGRQWIGVGCVGAGLALLAITVPAASGAHSSYGTILVLFPTLGVPHEHHGVLLGTAAGILFGVSDVAVKALTGGIGHAGLIGFISPWALTAVIASLISFFACARGLQKGDAVPVITTTSAAANLTAIAGGIVVFGDPMPNSVIGIVAQSVAFLLVIFAAALTPAPLRAANQAA